MSAFESLHPALQHHIVNSLGWRDLRPFQKDVIPQVLDKKNLIVLAPTAGGKTEASFFPIASRMLTEEWEPLSVLYICPIKALLNNLNDRLQYYCGLLGRRAELWHGDVKASARKKILKEPPDILLTTPESIEVMLVSQSVDHQRMFKNVRAVIVDEIHAFAGDDRGWHLLSVLSRVCKIAENDVQRLGLSATVGNPDVLVDWLCSDSPGPREVYKPPPSQDGGDADVQLDYVGSADNAALMLSRLYRGEKRLVFTDSRARAEEISTNLRSRQISTFVTHSSLSQDERRQAEQAFAERDDCVIVATSVLELGVDVGDLDRVVQIDSPSTVASFLQRMGRTGRRSGSRRNCLFLTTRSEALVQATALIDLWSDGYVEPVEPPALPYHILAQQVMATALQKRGIGKSKWFESVAGVPGYDQMSEEARQEIFDWMLQREILAEDSGIVWLGQEGESTFGRRNFMDLFSVFTSPPVFKILQGRRELGTVDISTFLSREDGPRVLLLGGRAWRVTHLNWNRRTAFVEAVELRGRSRWQGDGQGLGYRFCQQIQQVLAMDDDRSFWSDRARERIGEIRQNYPWLDHENTVVVPATGGYEWWTFAGKRANLAMAGILSAILQERCTADDLMIRWATSSNLDAMEQAIHQLKEMELADIEPLIDDQAIEGLKFSECLPHHRAIELLQARLNDRDAVQLTLAKHTRLIAAGGQ
ncbi:DEAD/DEAH box helicase [Mariniblastus fucicola]|uniref:ATP-dependent RNA helicase RhlE n=1 Tax=Mariniblastus fucicola TaxID=980251 RepID=A0A5B9PET6_9BACT|nr:DEAD/DEAH box helicase [Mariniblastus fucicola]QEG24774.1 ATP-dependent RNA helicase RhlE [Mariniblastus fucicola]